MRSSIRVAPIGLILVFLLAPGHARAGNDDGVLLGNEAAMTAASGGALVSDGSAIWYNPAGLASVDRASLDLSGSATMLRIGITPGLLQSAGGPQSNGSYYEFLGIPSALTLAPRLEPKLTFGLGIFVPQLAGHTDRVRLDESTDRYDAQLQLTQQESSSTYYGGISLGYAIAPNVRIGATIYGSYTQFALTSQFTFGLDNADGTGAASAGGSSTLIQAVALRARVGLQWEIVPGFHAGLTVRSPSVLIGSQYRFTSGVVTVDPTDPTSVDFGITDESGIEPRFDPFAPARVRLSLAYRWSEGWIGIEGDFQHELRVPSAGVDRDWIGGARAGGRWWVDRQVSLGAGFFTDLDATRRIDTYGQTRLDYYGGTFGLELRNPHRLGEGESVSDIVFVNTFALRYAVGVGSIGGQRFDFSAPDENGIVSVVEVATTVHEISLHLGSALYF